MGDAVLVVAGLCAASTLLLAQTGARIPANPGKIAAARPPQPLNFAPQAAALASAAKPLTARSAPSPGPSSVARLADFKVANAFVFKGAHNVREYAVNCLAAAAWYEAGADPQGQNAVIQVVLNRLKHPTFPKTICGVVFQGSERSTGCQFTFTCDGSFTRRFPTPTAWSSARVRAQAALDGSVDRAVLQATHYHADYVSPWWSSKLERLAKVGAHIFYRWPGGRGALSASPIGASEADGALVDRFSGNNPMRLPQPQPKITPDLSFIATSGDGSAPGRLGRPLPPSAPGNAFAQHGNLAEPSGRWAIEALRRCSGLKGCMVTTYESSQQANRNQALPPRDRERPLFLFVREPVSGMTVTLWDCNRAPRPKPAQCLPASATELKALMSADIE